MCPIYEIRFIDPKGRHDFTRMYGGEDMIAHLNNLVLRGWNVLSCIIV
jgi:hypothetical protein